jgi:hypothetical protein
MSESLKAAHDISLSAHRDVVYLTTYRASQDMREIEHYPLGLAMNERN